MTCLMWTSLDSNGHQSCQASNLMIFLLVDSGHFWQWMILVQSSLCVHKFHSHKNTQYASWSILMVKYYSHATTYVEDAFIIRKPEVNMQRHWSASSESRWSQWVHECPPHLCAIACCQETRVRVIASEAEASLWWHTCTSNSFNPKGTWILYTWMAAGLAESRTASQNWFNEWSISRSLKVIQANQYAD